MFNFNLSKKNPLVPLLELMKTDNWAEAKRIIQKHPELLTREAEVKMTTMEKFLRQNNDMVRLRVLTERQTLLKYCRKTDIEKAFNEAINQFKSLSKLP